MTGAIAAVILLVPTARGAILRTAIHEEQARIAPVIAQLMRQISRNLDRGRSLHVTTGVKQSHH
ncbi:MAG TPA: hypothetical protein VMF09_08945 [Solirubrobacteraceae bacterium]|nr:hypothetical protein [Solirubrobacteraceae bacterium]